MSELYLVIPCVANVHLLSQIHFMDIMIDHTDKLVCGELTEEDRVQIALGTKKLFEVTILLARTHTEVPAKVWDEWYTVQIIATGDDDAIILVDNKFFGMRDYMDNSLLSPTHLLNQIKDNLQVKYKVREVLGHGEYTRYNVIYKKDVDTC